MLKVNGNKNRHGNVDLYSLHAQVSWLVGQIEDAAESMHKKDQNKYRQNSLTEDARSQAGDNLVNIIARMKSISSNIDNINDTIRWAGSHTAGYDQPADALLKSETNAPYDEETAALDITYIVKQHRRPLSGALYNTFDSLIKRVDHAVASIKSYFELLQYYADNNELQEYIDTALALCERQQDFQSTFKQAYKSYISDNIEKQEQILSDDFTESEMSDTERSPKDSWWWEDQKEEEEGGPLRKPTKEEEEEEEEESGPPTMRSVPHQDQSSPTKWEVGPDGIHELKRAMLRLQHARFVEELKKAATSFNNPYLLAAMLAKYSGQIDDGDLDASLKLIAVAEGILSEY